MLHDLDHRKSSYSADLIESFSKAIVPLVLASNAAFKALEILVT